MKKYREYTFKDGSTKQEFIGDEEKPKYVKEQEEGFYRLKPGRFVGGKWVAEDAPKQGGSTGASTPSIKLINYNVWFSVLNQEERAKALLDTVQEQEPGRCHAVDDGSVVNTRLWQMSCVSRKQLRSFLRF